MTLGSLLTSAFDQGRRIRDISMNNHAMVRILVIFSSVLIGFQELAIGSDEISNAIQGALTEYFSKTNEQTSVQYELLRKSGTVTGVSFPKFYAWVKVFKGRDLNNQGVVYLSYMPPSEGLPDSSSVDIREFIDLNTIRSNPKLVAFIFPKALCPYIYSKAGIKVDLVKIYPTAEEFKTFYEQRWKKGRK